MNLYINIEIFNREFLSKLLISMESASNGINAYLGRIKPYLLRGFFEPGVILLKSITPTPARLKELKYYKIKNFIVTSLDEEVGLIDINPNEYLLSRYSNQSVELTDKIFTWGKFDYDNLSKKFKKYKKKFVLSGNPRVDFWRKDFDFYFKKKKLNHKNFIFFSLNFSFLIPKEEFNRYLIFLKESEYVKRGYPVNRIKKTKKDSYRMFKEFSKLIIALSKKNNLKIVVRPHPSDPINNYNFLKKYKNIVVSKKGSISEWIYYSRLVIHSGCTGGFESSIRGYPTINYKPFKSTHGHEYANNFSKKIESLDKCIKFIDKELKKDLVIDKTKLKNIKERSINVLSKNPAYKIIAHQFLKLLKEKKFDFPNNNFLLKIRFSLRDLRSSILGLRYGDERKFTYFKKDEILRDFEILKNLNPKYQKLKINFLKKDIIQIKRID